MDLVHVHGADLGVETFGEPGQPALLLIAGANSSMDGWDPAFCAALASGPRFVIRYDHRDTGDSTTWPAGKPGYPAQALQDDAIALLDALGVGQAHLVGVSMGGAIAQLLALDHPDRVASLTLIATSSGPADDLPPMADELRAYFGALTPPDWSDRTAVLDYLMGFQHALVPGPIDEPAARAMFARMVDRGSDTEANLSNHDHLDQDGDGWRARLSDLRVPTLVIHGERDPLFPPGHGEALAREIPGATGLILPGMGHEAPPPATWDVVVPAILHLTSGGWAQQADRLAARALAAGRPTGWFEQLYAGAAAGRSPMPWDGGPRRELVDWAASQTRVTGRRAVVVGAGLGENAELISGLGYETLAFDIAPTAVAQARRRFPESTVEYTVGDLLDLPPAWLGAFDLVVEVYTVQALPRSLRAAATANVARLVAPGGRLIVIAVADTGGPTPDGPPWPLTRPELDAFAATGLEIVHDELLTGGGAPRWRLELRRPAT